MYMYVCMCIYIYIYIYIHMIRTSARVCSTRPAGTATHGTQPVESVANLTIKYVCIYIYIYIEI